MVAMANFSLLWESWWRVVPSPWLCMILAITAVLCGILVGSERQRREKPAGMRTLTLVCLGSCVFTMLSFAFTSTTGDSGRVAAQIVTGIGFLGAGVILHGRNVITGMTTAALIWMTAAIGMTVGAGYVLGGLFLSILVNRILVGVFLYETRWHPDLRKFCVVLDYAPKNGITRIRLERVIADYTIAGVYAEWSEPSPEMGRLTLNLRLGRVHLYELLDELAHIPEVTGVRQTACP